MNYEKFHFRNPECRHTDRQRRQLYIHSYAARFHERRISSLTFTSVYLCVNVYMRVGVARALADSSDFGLLGSKVHQNVRFPALDEDEPPSKSRRR